MKNEDRASVTVSSAIPRFVAHVSDDGRYEPVRQHLDDVAHMARDFAEPFGMGEWAYTAGLYHDIGKYSQEFQRRILYSGPRCDHSTAGAYEVDKINTLLAYAIAGHHGGLPDGGSSSDNLDEPTLMGRLYRADCEKIPHYAAYKDEEIGLISSSAGKIPQETITPVRETPEDIEYSRTFLTRMIYSCLVDADFLCTERFMKGEERKPPSQATIEELRERLEAALAKFYPPKTPINELRCQVLDDCLKAASGSKGFYSLTVPTGGGKTFASLRFALAHAAAHGMSRVIYGIPYTSIIEQNAQVFREVLGAESVLEHHGSIEFDRNDNDSIKVTELLEKLKLASENWDAPLVVTTNVQLFESLYASKPSRCRKLHNLVNAVIILDEAQMLPSPQLLPCLRALVELVHNYGCTVVFCTATQPAFDTQMANYGFDVTEIASQVKEFFEALHRVTYQDLGMLSDEELVERLIGHEQVLCIVNSRAQARHLYSLLAEQVDDGAFHLSTLMYPEHRTETLTMVRHRLKKGLPCRLISTSLVEAGVDLDFPVVYRALAGLDSLIQAAGRCNRNAKNAAEQSYVYFFESAEDYRLPTEIQYRRAVTRDFVAAGAYDIDDPVLVARYFQRLFDEGNLDRAAVLHDMSDPARGVDGIPFRSVDKRFNMIEDGSYSVVIPHPAIGQAIDELRAGRAEQGTLRRLARYSVSVYESDLKRLLAGGIVEPLVKKDRVFVVIDKGSYKQDTGLEIEVEEGRGLYF